MHVKMKMMRSRESGVGSQESGIRREREEREKREKREEREERERGERGERGERESQPEIGGTLTKEIEIRIESENGADSLHGLFC